MDDKKRKKPAKKPATRKTTTKKPAAKKPASRKTTAKKSAAKKSASRKTTAKKPAKQQKSMKQSSEQLEPNYPKEFLRELDRMAAKHQEPTPKRPPIQPKRNVRAVILNGAKVKDIRVHYKFD